ncbi:ATP-grasp fold amidoligase family protein [Formosa maritima]|uniref:Glycosyl transferase n=1 Tax=Formosa maritima TaxID=2592046 RepID=A0A5D0GIX0_9FLAO|nr:ATP-grasp fold amidoligase family protein [Formosa maritima]TYA58938.1 glycosyl transferase [Formosa maritima]
MKEFIRKLYLETTYGPYLIQPFYGAYNYVRFTIVDDVTRINKEFLKNFNKKPDLNNPKTFNEKLQWLKLNDRTPLHTLCADKYRVREYVKEKVGDKYLIPLVFETTNLKDIKPENIPNFPVIIKANHDSSGGSIITDKKNINWTVVRNKLFKSLHINYYTKYKEWQYKDIEPRIIVEKLLQHEDGSIPFDYKMHYFNGELVFTQVDLDRHTDHTRNLYDVNWNFLDIEWVYKNGRQLEKPDCYEEMKVVSKALAQDFCYTRVDLYTLNNKVYFGEITLHSESGFGVFKPDEWDLKFGDRLKLPKK